MTTPSYDYLLPQPDAETQGWWDAARRHELVVQECTDCGKLRHPPQSLCSNCGSEQRQWRAMSGRGTLYSYVIVHRATLPQWRESVPYNVALVALDDAPEIRLYGNVIDVDNTDLRVGQPLEVVFDDVTPDETLIRWRPTAS